MKFDLTTTKGGFKNHGIQSKSFDHRQRRVQKPWHLWHGIMASIITLTVALNSGFDPIQKAKMK